LARRRRYGRGPAWPPRRFLPSDPRVEEPYRLTPQLAFRIAILGAIVLAVFAVLFLRLWALQILSGPQYLNAAQNNQVRIVRIQAPRGPILDRNGVPLVENTAGHSVQLWPADLPRERRYALLKRLETLLDVPLPWMVDEIEKRRGDPLTPIVLKRGIHPDQVAYLSERKSEFPGVTIARSYLRRYPFRAMGAHMLGHVGEATEKQIEASSALRLGDEVGQAGIEARYDDFLRGVPGIAQMRVDSLGRPRSSLLLTQQPQPGKAVRLTIDARLQRAAQQAIRYGIETAIENEAWYANAGAVVAMDPRTGEVLALASEPSFQPSVFVGRSDPEKLAPLVDDGVAAARNFPALNRATQGLYPPGSVWKPVAALAGMQEKVLGAYENLHCTAEYVFRGEDGVDYVFGNWDKHVNQWLDLRLALAKSCDTYFYELAMRFHDLPPERGSPHQAWAAKFGFGEASGIDVGPEESGLLPTPEWRRETYTKERYPNTWEIERLWKPGDSIQLAIGQKDLLVTPMQMARFYAMVANGGKLVTPHLFRSAEIPGSTGAEPQVVHANVPPPALATGVDPGALEVVRQGLLQATHYPHGTSAGVFDAYPIRIAGKTGTAEKWSTKIGDHLDQSWWCGFGPFEDPELVVCALIENGGHGSVAAAPTAMKVFEAFFGVEAGYLELTRTD
jgi:penicillin-binding protein 2